MEHTKCADDLESDTSVSVAAALQAAQDKKGMVNFMVTLYYLIDRRRVCVL